MPACGVLWGVATQQPTVASVDRVQKGVGRRFDFVYRFHDVNDVVPTADEQRQVRDGTILHVSIGARDFAIPQRQIRWADIADGQYDAELRRQARGIAALRKPVFVTFEHEANQTANAALGTPSDFVAAWRHMHQLYRQAGASNAVWVWVMMGDIVDFRTIPGFWPGNKVVDWISWDVYNASGCRAGRPDPSQYASFAELVLPFYDWIHVHGSEHGIDADKPMMISETGSTPYVGDMARTAKWYADLPYGLQQFPQIRAVGLWNRSGNAACDYRFEDQPDTMKALSEAGRSEWVTSGDPSMTAG